MPGSRTAAPNPVRFQLLVIPKTSRICISHPADAGSSISQSFLLNMLWETQFFSDNSLLTDHDKWWLFCKVMVHFPSSKNRNRYHLSIFNFILIRVDITQHCRIVANLSSISVSAAIHTLLCFEVSYAYQPVPACLIYFDSYIGDRSVWLCECFPGSIFNYLSIYARITASPWNRQIPTYWTIIDCFPSDLSYRISF